jgi:hypothetical protein
VATKRKTSRKKARGQRVWTVSALRKSAVAEVRSFARLAKVGRVTRRDLIAFNNAMDFISRYGAASDKVTAKAIIKTTIRALAKRPKRSR